MVERVYPDIKGIDFSVEVFSNEDDEDIIENEDKIENSSVTKIFKDCPVAIASLSSYDAPLINFTHVSL